MTAPIHVAAEVAAALRDRRPVVALESTVITHGLPAPDNVATALAMEEHIRAHGAVPATIAILHGMPTIGIGADEIRRLGGLSRAQVRKCSRRDLPIAAARGEDASTTVAATMILAHLAGVRVFATGGIGGVHRGQPADVSADLIELGRTPVAVVCSGPKAILDVPLTLEVLETQGVPILGLGTDELPGFYTRSTGWPVDVAVATPAEAAAIVAAAQLLGGRQGVLVVVPPPAVAALEPTVVETAIARAIAEAEAQGVRGKALTPFLLERLAALTGGATQRTNIALLTNNAGRAADLAVALALLG
jgi:pseudouridine-5'-phosphate glycosidase